MNSRNSIRHTLMIREVQPTWCNHDFMLLGSHSQECQIILRIGVADAVASICDEAVQKTSILNSCCIVHGSSDWNACNKIEILCFNLINN